MVDDTLVLGNSGFIGVDDGETLARPGASLSVGCDDKNAGETHGETLAHFPVGCAGVEVDETLVQGVAVSPIGCELVDDGETLAQRAEGPKFAMCPRRASRDSDVPGPGEYSHKELIGDRGKVVAGAPQKDFGAAARLVHFGCEDGLCKACMQGDAAGRPDVRSEALDLPALANVDCRLADVPDDAAPPNVTASVHQYAAMQFWSDGWSVDDIAEVMALNPDIVRRLVH